eukprot:TRINITY_DN1845_c0_g1_i1.p1 TRINITY_DN1845_c0_g1~~TRINITY_DN1845_c0_g1_i1.p1  ORF type:complete len:307 (-),score=67.23 TRINITY_DN1845_c0_g1_i1:115-1005(-)
MSLFDVESYLLLGHFQACVNAAEALKTSDASVGITRDVYMYRAHIALGNFGIVTDDIPEDAPTALQAVKLLALIHLGELAPDAAVATVTQWEQSGAHQTNTDLQVVMGLLLVRVHQFEMALRVLHGTSSYEGRALLVQLFLQLNRPDVAAKEFASLQRMKDDAIATQLASTWVNMSLGQRRVVEAMETYQELIDKYGPSVSLLNGLAVANLQAGNLANAETVLRDALLIDNKDATTHVNLAVTAELSAQPDSVRRQTSMLVRLAPQHPWVVSAKRAEDHFDKTFAEFTAEKQNVTA